MNAKAYLDTNILVYARDSSQPEKQAIAFQLIKSLWLENKAMTGIQNLNEYYVTVTRKLKLGLSAEEAWADVLDFMVLEPVELTVGILKEAHILQTRYKFSWWDCLVIAGAKVSGCSLLYSEDLQAGQDIDGLKIINPFC